MKFTTVWSESLAQNATLKMVLVVTALLATALAATTARLALREPLVIERGCTSSVAVPRDSKVTDTELKAFVTDAVRRRFDTDGILTQEIASPAQVSAKA